MAGKQLTPHDELTIVKLLASGNDTDFVAAAVQQPKATVVDVACRHGHPDRDKLAWAADIMQGNIDRARAEALPAGRALAAPPLPAPPRPAPARAKPTPPQQASRTAPTAGLVSIAKIRFHPANVGRDLGDLRDLTASIKERGILVPVVLERHNGGLRLRDGHRRITAARLANVSHVLAIVYGDALDEADWLLESIDYNERRKGMTDEDKRRVTARLLELNVSRAAVAEAFGISTRKVAELVDKPKPKVSTPSRPARPATVVSVKALREFLDVCEGLGYSTDVQVMLTALIDGRPWRTVDEAYPVAS